LMASVIIITTNVLIILLSFGLLDVLGNSTLFFLLLATGFVLANVPSMILRFRKRNAEEVKESKSIFAFMIFTKKEK